MAMGKRKAPPAAGEQGGRLEDVESWSTEGRRWGMLALLRAGWSPKAAAGLMAATAPRRPRCGRGRRSRPAATCATPPGRGGRVQ